MEAAFAASTTVPSARYHIRLGEYFTCGLPQISPQRKLRYHWRRPAAWRQSRSEIALSGSEIFACGTSEIFDESNVKLRQGAVKEIAKRFKLKAVR